jgi:hypothetical protein
MLLDARKAAEVDPNASHKPKECNIGGGFGLLCRQAVYGKD